MLNLKRGFNDSSDVKTAVNSVISEINQNDVKLVIFFSSPKYDFSEVSKLMNESFKSAEVIGCTTAGEIGPKGFTQGSLVAMSIAADDFEVSTAIIKDIKTRAMFGKSDIMKAFNKTGLDINDPNVNKKGFGILLVDGLLAAEEKVLSVLNSALKDFTIVGGSAADDLKLKEVFVSSNGEVYKNAALVTFVKTSKKFFAYKENIYAPTDKELTITKSDLESRIVYEINNMPAADAYAKALGIPREKLTEECFFSNPVGRQFGNSIWIASPWQLLDNGAIQFYAQVMPNTVVKILKPVNTVEEARNTVKAVKAAVPNVKGIIGFNCLTRYMQFKGENTCGPIYNELSNLGQVIGFVSYGEQFGGQQVNQTLTLIALGE